MISSPPSISLTIDFLKEIALKHQPVGSNAEAVVDQWLHAVATNSQLFCNKSICETDDLKNEILSLLKTNNVYQNESQFYELIFGSLALKPQKQPKFRFIDLFAGVGGIRLGFQGHGGACVFSSEFEKNAQQTYKANHGELPFGDITQIKPEDIPDHDILLAGFPCQAFSIAGYRQGFEDQKGRGNLFFNIVDILKEKKPNIFVLENVKNLKSHDQGRTFQRICHELTSLNYYLKAQILNAKDYGLHQNRERIFLVGYKNLSKNLNIKPLPSPQEKLLTISEIDKWLTENANFEFSFPPKQKKLLLLEDFNLLNISNEIKLDKKITAKLIEPSAKYFQKFSERDDWCDFIYNGKAGHFKKAVDYINSKFSKENKHNFVDWNTAEVWDDDKGYQHIYQWRRKYVRRNKGGVCPTLTANMGTGGHNVPLIVCGVLENGDKLIRKLTPEECFALQGFNISYIKNLKNVSISNAKKYQQAGNSVPVAVINEIAKHIVAVIKN